MTSKEAKMFRMGVFTFLGVLLIAGPAGAVDPADKCLADKLKAAGKYASCLLSVESKAAKKQELPSPEGVAKCDLKYNDKWAKAEAKGGEACPTTPPPKLDTESTVLAFVAVIVGALGPPLTQCIEGGAEACEGEWSDPNSACGICVRTVGTVTTPCEVASSDSCISGPKNYDCSVAMNASGCGGLCCGP
jgi:hypothetical protein